MTNKQKIILFIVILLTSCNPYQGLAALPVSTETPARSTATPQLSQLATIDPTPNPTTCKVTTGIDRGRLNIRSGAGVSHSVIALLHEGEVLTVMHSTASLVDRGAWMYVRTSRNVKGWINSKYCKIGDNDHGKSNQ